MEKIYTTITNLNPRYLLLACIMFAISGVYAQCNFTYNVGTSYATCSTSADGTANITVWGGVQPYKVEWDNGETGYFASQLTAGQHSVSVTDSNGCSEVAFVIIEPGPESIWLMPEVTCAGCGTCDGTAQPHAMLGIPPYTYAWSDGQTTEIATGLCPGTITVTVSDTQGCSSVRDIIICTDGSSLTVSCSSTNVGCQGADGTATATPMGGVAPFTYLWSNGATTATITDLTPGTYTATVMDADGCIGTCSSTVGGDSNNNLSATASATDSECGSSNGTATVNATGGAGNYQYSWSNSANTQSIDGLAPGLYSVTVTDGDGCTTTASANVDGSSAPDAPGISTDDPTEICQGSGAGTIVTATINGTPAANNIWVLTDLNGEILATNNTGIFDFVGFDNGSYQIWNIAYDGTIDGANVGDNVSGLAGCFAVSDPITVSLNSVEAAEISTQDATTVCVGDGESDLINVDIDSSGSGNNSFWIITDNAGNILDLPVAPPFEFEGAPAGVCLIWYLVTDGAVDGLEVGNNASDVMGCLAFSNAIEVTRNENPTVTIDPRDVEVCMGESVDLSADATGNNLTYEWFASQGILSSTNTANTTFTMMAPGTYQIIVSVSTPDGCMAMDMTTVTILQGAAVSVSSNGGPICEEGDSIDLTADGSGGNDLTYAWTSSGGNLSSTTGESTTFTMMTAGTYDIEVVVTNEDGCTASSSTSVMVGIFNATASESSPISACGEADGEISVETTGGNGSFSYSWDNGSTDASISGLEEGCYSVTITDDLTGCTRTDQVCLDDGGLDIGNYVWWDRNENCEQDQNEQGVHGVPVSLMGPGPDGICGNADDVLAPNGSTNTDADGLYIFECVAPGTYYVQFGATIVYSGTEYTCRDGAVDVLDSDVDDNGKSHVFDVLDTDGDGLGDVIDTDGDGLGNDKQEFSFDAGIFDCCNDVNSGGTISGSQSICQGEVPSEFTSVVPAGGGGAKPIEYLWICSVAGGTPNPATWTELPNSNSETYQAGPVYQTKFFARCARRECCDAFIIESNVITVEVLSCLQVITFTVEELRGGDDGVRLAWITSKDSPNGMYSIERSADAANYETIGEVASSSNGEALNLYEFMDMDPMKGENYYRVRIIKANGDFEFTKVEMLDFSPDNDTNFEISPNPVVNSLNLESFIRIDSKVEIQILNTTGKQLNSTKIDASSYMNEDVDISNLPSGTYFLKVIYNGTSEIIKFTKAN